MSESTRQIVASVRSNLRTARSRLLLARTAQGALVALVAFVLLWLILGGAEALLWMPGTLRTLMVVGGCVAFAALVVRLVADPIVRLAGFLTSPDENAVAHLVEQRIPSARNRLVNLLHLSPGRHSSSTTGLVDDAIEMLGAPMTGDRFREIEDFRDVRRTLRVSSIPLAVLATVLLAAPGPFLGATARLTNPGVHFERPAPFTVDVAPGSVEIIRGDSLLMEVSIGGTTDLVPLVDVRRTGERSVATTKTVPTGERAFMHVEKNVRQSFEYRVRAEPISTEWFTVSVVDRPVVRQINVIVRNPAYSRVGPVALGANVGDVTALPGSTVELSVELG
ncbi:MAG: hypothetical protein R3178_03395, partial [Rhodothermales bacterium]|nr:hypothetical protein [Rhodothermales bacterium]